MPVASDFTFIVGDNEVEISESTTDRVPANPGSPPGPLALRTRSFEFEVDHPTSGDGVLAYMVRALSNPEYDEPEVLVNNHAVGRIQRSTGAQPSTWYTQVIRIDSGLLRHGPNTLKINLALRPGAAFDSRNRNDDDSYFLRGVVCHYRKAI